MTNNTKIIIDSRTNIPYGSFYMKGLIELFGKINVKFSSLPFANLSDLGWNIRFVIKYESREIKYFIHTSDSYQILPEHYAWCDVYGNVNANYNHFPKEKYPKQISLVPSFAVRNFNFSETLYYSVKNFFISFDDISKRAYYNKYSKQNEQKLFKNIKKHFSNYLKNYLNRLPIDSYENHTEVIKHYIFFLSSLWYSDDWNRNDEGVNRRRANFIEVVKELPHCIFEGGLLAVDVLSSSSKFSLSVTNQRVNLSTWIQKTKKSELVFNTPAFWDCHGWKLGEYLAMGKAIISTPLSNDLPSPLIHGTHIHFIPNSSKPTIKEAVEYILQHPDYRKHLEKNAKLYWDTYGTPEQSLSLLGIGKHING